MTSQKNIQILKNNNKNLKNNDEFFMNKSLTISQKTFISHLNSILSFKIINEEKKNKSNYDDDEFGLYKVQKPKPDVIKNLFAPPTITNQQKQQKTKHLNVNENNNYNHHHNLKKEDIILSKLISECSKETEDRPFWIINLKSIFEKYFLWKKLLPKVTPFYAVKCNNNLEILKILYQLGTGFDCASKKEIDIIKNLLKNNNDLSSIEDKIIFANPTKPSSHIEYAKSIGVKYVTVDNVYELYKLKKRAPESKILIRIKTDDSHSICRFSTKFGADVNEDCEKIIKLAIKLNLNLVGVSFHVGSGCQDSQSYAKALIDTKKVFEMAKQLSNGNYCFKIVDIGGGFPGDDDKKFKEMAKTINHYLEKYFGFMNDIKFIAEPGRYFATSCHTLVCQIVSRRDLTKKQRETTDVDSLLYINDGLYGSFNCILYDHINPKMSLIYKTFDFEKGEVNFKSLKGIKDQDSKNDKVNESTIPIEKKKFKMFGPTCDSFDCIYQNIELPEDIKPEDFMYFKNFGAYTSCASSDFNGFKNHHTYYVWY